MVTVRVTEQSEVRRNLEEAQTEETAEVDVKKGAA